MSTNGEIRADAMYTLAEIQARLGVKRAAWRSFVKAGLPVKRIGRRGYVRGQDAIAFIASR